MILLASFRFCVLIGVILGITHQPGSRKNFFSTFLPDFSPKLDFFHISSPLCVGMVQFLPTRKLCKIFFIKSGGPTSVDPLSRKTLFLRCFYVPIFLPKGAVSFSDFQELYAGGPYRLYPCNLTEQATTTVNCWCRSAYHC